MDWVNKRLQFCRLSAIAVLLGGSLLVCPSKGLAEENWARWRGPKDEGSVAEGTYPVKWDLTNLVWQASLPGKGCSTPVVWARQIYLTAPVDGLDGVQAFDWAGKLVWQRTFETEKPGKHRSGSGSNPSPTTDGRGVFVYYNSGTLAALEQEGQVRWQTNLVKAFGPETLYWDQGISPLLVGDTVVIARMHHGESWLAAFDQANGRLRWKVARNFTTPVEGDHSYTSPLLIPLAPRPVILVYGAEHLTTHDPADGHLLWSCGDFNPRAMQNWPTVASPVVVGDIAVVAGGRSDRGQPLLYGIRLGGQGEATASQRVWKREDTGTFVPTPAVYQNRVYLLRDRGEVECLDPATGQTLWRDTLPKNSANYYASPLIAGGRLYAAREDGVVFVVQIDGKFQVLAENAMGERIIASPVPVSNRLLIRGERHLFCVGAK